VGECALWARLTGQRFALQVAAVVCLIEAPSNCYQTAKVAKEVMAIRYHQKISLSIKKVPRSAFRRKQPNLIKKRR
jgi:hypothetical protein